MLYKKGDKVIPIRKTVGVSFEKWSKGRDGLGTKMQGYTNVTVCDAQQQVYCCYHNPELLFISNSGNYFKEEDLIPYKVNEI